MAAPERPLRVCVLSPFMRKHSGYIPSPAAIIASFLADLGHRVVILTGDIPEGGGAVETVDGLEIHYLAGVPPKKDGGAYWPESAAALDRLHEETPFDAVIGRGVTTWGFLRHSRYAEAIPLILHEGTYPRWLHQIESRLGGLLSFLTFPLAPVFALRNPKEYRCMQRAFRVVCIAPALAAAVERCYWWRRPRTLAITYGFDTGPYHPVSPDPAATPRLVSLGRMTWDKGVLRMIKVLAALKNRQAVLEAMGPASPKVRSAVLQLAADLGVADRYVASGVVQYEDVPARLAGAVAFLFPSTHAEGLGKVVLEAMASGVPVVAYRLPVLDGIIEDGVTGFQVPIRSIGAMAERVDQLLADPALQARMAAAGRRKIETQFAPDAIRAQWQALLAEVLAEAQARRRG